MDTKRFSHHCPVVSAFASVVNAWRATTGFKRWRPWNGSAQTNDHGTPFANTRPDSRPRSTTIIFVGITTTENCRDSMSGLSIDHFTNSLRGVHGIGDVVDLRRSNLGHEEEHQEISGKCMTLHTSVKPQDTE
ncbi:uncharacterized protein PHACADRAFT_251091 [Phanerochaete carnosa HHB-10118-sp]|uniref:Uncharacterized protein n=1 Tax=Phanerochaete carnosa (strain HHB-10118-sp) TaxID=650164 RepID=K5W0T5_PHACS|nr:uncharacterized protein PHACADRAFT_251091 [Phanerochaete carnosa HHB-10118-sp]EKM57433.1 hypothetical protein PHACADRAFT_251091 [Phanerochaete carnosa HHB-10118-sp]